jgi:hypothetical protein
MEALNTFMLYFTAACADGWRRVLALTLPLPLPRTPAMSQQSPYSSRSAFKGSILTALRAGT